VLPSRPSETCFSPDPRIGAATNPLMSTSLRKPTVEIVGAVPKALTAAASSSAENPAHLNSSPIVVHPVAASGSDGVCAPTPVNRASAVLQVLPVPDMASGPAEGRNWPELDKPRPDRKFLPPVRVPECKNTTATGSFSHHGGRDGHPAAALDSKRPREDVVNEQGAQPTQPPFCINFTRMPT
jgi:hypothetical protein